jgi:hypothetical protein
MLEVFAKQAQFARHAFRAKRIEAQCAQHIEVQIKEMIGFAQRVRATAFLESRGDVQQAVGDAFHGRNDDRHTGPGGRFADQAGGAKHAFGAKQRTAAEFEGQSSAGGFLKAPGAAGSDYASGIRLCG